jgi:regulator of sirC expression with transglutaminase-like and TPR domain
MEAAEQFGSLELFRAAVSCPDGSIDLVEAALLLARSEYPGLDCPGYRRQLDRMGEEAQAALGGAVPERLARLNQLMFARWGFRGNRADYYDPRNSFLNDVLDRRTGIPITLSLIYLEVGRRAGLNLAGVGMPGHFLVGVADHDNVYVDPFNEGNLLTAADCRGLLRELYPDARFHQEFLEPVGSRQILVRMVNNLLRIYLDAGRLPKALAMLEMILCLDWENPEWLHERALLHYRMKNYSLAIRDLEAYLARSPEAAGREEIAEQLDLLRQLRGMVN